jgi:hypothetical protein
MYTLNCTKNRLRWGQNAICHDETDTKYCEHLEDDMGDAALLYEAADRTIGWTELSTGIALKFHSIDGLWIVFGDVALSDLVSIGP